MSDALESPFSDPLDNHIIGTIWTFSSIFRLPQSAVSGKHRLAIAKERRPRSRSRLLKAFK